MDPITIATIASSLFGGLGGLFGGGGGDQQRQSFELSNLDPRDMLAASMQQISKLGSALDKKIGGGVRLRSAYAQPLQGLSGGGLPFNVGGGFAQDPAYQDRSMLNLPGLDLGDVFPHPGRYSSDVRQDLADQRAKRVSEVHPFGIGKPKNEADDALESFRRLGFKV